MSGVMTKVAIYAFIRIVFDLMGDPSWWWSLPALLLGGATAAIGVLYALMETDLKRVLAYSTIENVGIIFIAIGLALAFKANGLAGAAALALDRRVVPRPQPHAVQERSILRRRHGDRGDRRAGHGTAGRLDPPHAGLVCRISRCQHGHLSAAAVQRLRLRMADLSEHPRQPATAADGTEAAGARGRRPARSRRGASPPPASCAPSAATYLGRARTTAAAEARRSRSLVARGDAHLRCPLPVGRSVPGNRHRLAAAGSRSRSWPGICRRRPSIPWLSMVPVSASRSSYNGLLLFGFVAASAGLAAVVVHRFASRTVRRAPFWDCGYPGAWCRRAILRHQPGAADTAGVRDSGIRGA